MNTSRADAPLDTSPPHDPASPHDPPAPSTDSADAERIAAARALWPGSPTPALTYPDPPRPR